MSLITRRGALALAAGAAVLPVAASHAAGTGAREIADAFLAAWNAKDADAAAALLAEDATYFDVTVGEPQHGRQAARDNVIAVFMTAAPDLSWTMKGEPLVSDDGISFEWTFSGTNTGAWSPDLPATGKAFSFDGVTFMRIADGHITYQGDYYDGYGFQKQLGWIE
jgi:steroid delta-isomerase-like uncharacterized protein